jgi:hypothetical protein
MNQITWHPILYGFDGKESILGVKKLKVYVFHYIYYHIVNVPSSVYGQREIIQSTVAFFTPAVP